LTQALGCEGLNARLFAQTSIPKTGPAVIAPIGGEMVSLLKGKSSGKGVCEVCNEAILSGSIAHGQMCCLCRPMLPRHVKNFTLRILACWLSVVTLSPPASTGQATSAYTSPTRRRSSRLFLHERWQGLVEIVQRLCGEGFAWFEALPESRQARAGALAVDQCSAMLETASQG
jgi:hypothetical protein